jgi:acyl-CoA synthetase (AMP-forming)/AMP-acid ligase II
MAATPQSANQCSYDIASQYHAPKTAPMAPTTLENAFPRDTSATAIIIPSKPALTISYQRLGQDVKAFQQQLAKLGVSAQSAVSIALPNSYEFIVAFIAASWQRAIAAPLNPAYTQAEFEFYIDDLSSAIALVPHGAYAKDAAAVRAARKYNAAIAECYYNGKEVVLDVKEAGKLAGKNGVVESAQPEDVALVLHTSGTTGRPKAVPLTHRNLLRTMKNIQATYELSPKDRTMLVMPLFHVHGLLAGFLAPLASGGSVIVPPKFSASEFWADFNQHEANWYTAVPTIHQILLRSPVPSPKPNIRFIRSCSSPLSPKVFHELEETFGAPVLEAYAMTEASHQMTSNPLPPGKRMPGSVGIGQGVEVKILDEAGKEVPQGKEAEICIKGENVTKGYLNNPAANASSFTKDGFFRTGDQGKQDADGYVIITGRIKELINKGGEKISPIELDNVVAQNPAVSEAVSFALEDEMYGQDVGLAVVLKDGKKLTAADLKAWMAERVAKFKLPKKVRLIHSRDLYIDIDCCRSSSQTSCQRQLQERSRGALLLRPCSRRKSPGPSYSLFALSHICTTVVFQARLLLVIYNSLEYIPQDTAIDSPRYSN